MGAESALLLTWHVHLLVAVPGIAVELQRATVPGKAATKRTELSLANREAAVLA